MIKYRRQLIKYGEAAEVYIFPVTESGRAGKGSRGGRGKRRKPSRACQERLNNEHRAARVARELGYNFAVGDPVITLTYAGRPPESYEEAQKAIRGYLAKIKRAADDDIRYLYITEQGSRAKRWHHHLVLHAPGVAWETLCKKWGRGRVDISGLYFDDEGSARGLARYLCKNSGEGDEDGEIQSGTADKLKAGRVHRSRNIKQPPIFENDFEISRRAAGRIAGEIMHGDELGEVRGLEGYTVTSSGTFFNDINGGYYIRIYLKSGGDNFVQVRGRRGKADKRRPGTAQKIRGRRADTPGGGSGGASRGGRQGCGGDRQSC